MPFFANFVIPMLAIQWPLMMFATVPVIILEALLIRRWVPLSLSKAVLGMGLANISSTLIGVPLAWLAMLALKSVVLRSVGLAAKTWQWELDGPIWQVLKFLSSVAWLDHAQADKYGHWMAPAAIAVLLVPCFYLSVAIERFFCTRTWTTSDPARVRQGVFTVNLVSYIFLFILAWGWAAFELITRGPTLPKLPF